MVRADWRLVLERRGIEVGSVISGSLWLFRDGKLLRTVEWKEHAGTPRNEAELTKWLIWLDKQE